jgi:hypothetical protein
VTLGYPLPTVGPYGDSRPSWRREPRRSRRLGLRKRIALWKRILFAEFLHRASGRPQ